MSKKTKIEINDIIKMAIQEREEEKSKELRCKEIKDEIAKLEKEYNEIRNNYDYQQKWVLLFHEMVENAIEKHEKTK